jgi:predicted dehydrogenase
MKVGVIGLGYFSQFHLAAWVAQGADVHATDLDPDRRDWAGAEFRASLHETATALLDAAPDIVDIVAPPPAHAQLIRQSLAPGRIIICQKPFATSLSEARTLTQEAEAEGATLVIHENFRFQPWHRTIKIHLDGGSFGQVYGARFLLRPGDGRGPRAYLDRQPTFQTMPRLLIHETAVHFVDLFRWFFGEIEGVYADIRRLNPAIAGEDAGVLIFDHAGGVRSTFDGNRLADHVSDNPRRTMGEMLIEGEGGEISLDGLGCVRLRQPGASEMQILPPALPVDETRFGGGCVAHLIDHVVANIDSPERIENRADAYLPVISVVDAAYASAEAGRKLRPAMH